MLRRAFSLLGLAILTAFGNFSAFAATVDASLHNYSVRILGIQTTGQFGFDTSVDVTSSEFEANGELMPAEEFTHGGYFLLSDEILEDRAHLFFVDLPPYDDVNGNGIDDFFEFGIAVEGEGEGVYASPNGGDSLTATWSRAASNTFGVVTFTFSEPLEGTFQSFTHTFEIFHYTGEYSYERNGTNITGRLVNFRRLTESPTDPVAEIKGPLNLQVVNADRLTVLPNSWTNEYEVGLEFESILPGERAGDFYFADLFFTDFEPFTATQDYNYATLVLRDDRDSNGNGVPDLSDTGGVVGAPSRLQIAVRDNNLVVTVEGAVGTTHQLQFAASLAGSWSNRQAVTLSSPTQEIILPREPGQGYFRLARE